MDNFNNNFNKSQEVSWDDVKEEFKNAYQTKTKGFRKKKPKKDLIWVPVIALAFYYFWLPAINLHDLEFWRYIFITAGLSGLIIGPVFGIRKKYYKTLAILGLVVLVLLATSSQIFNAKSYAKILPVTQGDFAQEISEIEIDDIPTIDRDSAQRIGNREMGELYDLVSQFNLDQSYTQINYKSKPVRVTPLEYNGILKWLNNFREGIPSYMMVDMVDGDADLISLEEKIKYSHSDVFLRDVRRHMRIKYPTKIIRDISFEVDTEGRPYWICPTYTNRISWFGAMDVNGLITTNAATGETKYYDLEDVPSWVDRAFEADRIIEQLSWYGKYQNGFLNSKFAQKGVLQPTSGYNYLALEDDIYMYTGITSVAQDSSNIGFVLSNLRTKETKFYRLSSADEVSAMASAEGEVQEKNYRATFPILLNIKSKPTYFLSLKDNAGLIKTYAFVDAQNYQEVSIGNTVRAAYLRHLGQDVSKEEEKLQDEDLGEGSGTIATIQAVVIEGNTHYYFTLEGDESIYLTSIDLSSKLPFLKAGDKISFDYAESGDAKKLVNIK